MSGAASGEVALLASPGNHLMMDDTSVEQRKSRRATSRRGASPPPPPISRRTSLTLSSFSAATLTAPLLPMSSQQFPSPFAEFQRIGTPPVVTTSAVASMPVAAAAMQPPTRRFSSRLAAAAMVATVPLPSPPPSDRKLPARRKRPPAKVPRRNVKEALLEVAPSTPTAAADDDTPKKPPSRESTLCCICMSSLQDAGKEVARISCCTHEFCTPCILQWSQTENSCPLCKQRFTQITTQHPDTPRSSQRKRRSRAPRRITVPHRTQRSEAGRVLDSILQSLHGGGVAVGTGAATGSIGIGFAVGGTPPTQVMPWIVRGDASVELEQFLRRFFVSTTGEPRLVFGHSAETAIEIHEDEAVVELE